MTTTIVLTDLVITRMELDYIQQCVIVHYNLVDASGKVWDHGHAVFWVTLPELPRENWFQLPEEYFPTLLSLKADADAALTAQYL